MSSAVVNNFPRLLLLSTSVVIFVAAGCGGSAADFEREKAEIRAKAKDRARAEARGLIKEKEVATEVGLKWPVKEVTATYAELRQRVARQVQKEVLEKFPENPVDQFKAEAKKKYPAKKIGEEVSFVIRQGKGSNPEVEGAFMEVTEDRVKIGSRWVLKDDIRQEDLVKFDEELRKELRERYVLRQNARHNAKRQEFIDKRRKELYRQALLDAEYQKWRGKYVDATKVLDKAIEERVKEKAERIRPGLEREMLQDAGFVLKDGEWKPSFWKRLF